MFQGAFVYCFALIFARGYWLRPLCLDAQEAISAGVSEQTLAILRREHSEEMELMREQNKLLKQEIMRQKNKEEVQALLMSAQEANDQAVVHMQPQNAPGQAPLQVCSMFRSGIETCKGLVKVTGKSVLARGGCKGMSTQAGVDGLTGARKVGTNISRFVGPGGV